MTQTPLFLHAILFAFQEDSLSILPLHHKKIKTMRRKPNSDLNRRSFLRVSAAGLLGAGLSANTASLYKSTGQEIPQIEEFRSLGSTGFRVSCISAGSSNRAERFHDNLLKTGINLLDTSPEYNNEETVGKAIANVDRESVFVIVKFFPKVIKEWLEYYPFTKEDVLKSFHSSLEKINTGYADCFMLQSASSSELVKNRAFHEAFEQLKRENKARYCGIACHGHYWLDETRETMEQICQTAIDDGRIDIILLVYNFMQYDEGERILRACHNKGIGTLVMKGDPIPRYRSALNLLDGMFGGAMPDGTPTRITDKFKKEIMDFEKFLETRGIADENEIHDSAVKFVLNNPYVNSYLYGFGSYELIDRIVPLSGQEFTTRDSELLSSYEKNCGSMYCRHACGICEPACPHKIPVNDLLRYRHYNVGNGDEAYALRQYNGSDGPKADKCFDCEGFCEKACPYGVYARSMLIDAHCGLNLKG